MIISLVSSCSNKNFQFQHDYKIRSHDNNISLVFTTGIPDYIEEGYEVNALHYLRKPLIPEKVFACLDKVSSRTKTEHFIVLQTPESNIVKIAQEHILYIEARGHETLIQPDQGQVILSKTSISQLEKMLDAKEFIKCHRSYLCRISAIYRIDKDTIYFENGCRIPVSRRVYQTVNQAFIQYYRSLIIGNLMDNAIEACLKIEEPDKRFIRIYIDIFKGQLYIYVLNAMTGTVKRNGKIYYSSKNSKYHGFGLMRIDKVVERCKGYLNRQDEEGVFATEIMLPL